VGSFLQIDELRPILRKLRKLGKFGGWLASRVVGH